MREGSSESTVRPPQSFHTSSALSVGRLRGTSCARSLPVPPCFRPRAPLLQSPCPDPAMGLGELAQASCYIAMGFWGTLPAGRSAVTPRFQDWSPCQYRTPLKWFLGTLNYGHLKTNILQSTTFASQRQSRALQHCKKKDPRN